MGVAVHGLRARGTPVRLPAWLAGKPLNEWFEIASAAGGGGAAYQNFSGAALNRNTGEVWIPAAGGHGTDDNRVVSLALAEDTPVWVIRKASSTSFATTLPPYNPDGTPAARHTYWSSHYIEQRGRVMLFGAFGLYGVATTADTVDGFNPATDAWDAAGTWADTVAGWNAGFGNAVDSSGNVYSTLSNKISKWDQATATHSVLADFGGGGEVARSNCWDAGRNQVVSIGFGNGRDAGSGSLSVWKWAPDGSARTAVTLTGSALAQFTSEGPYAFGIEYDAGLDKILIYTGGLISNATVGASTSKVYVVTPDASASWDISLLTLGGGSVTPDIPGSGIYNQFRYVPSLKGCVYVCASGSKKTYFMRTS